MDWNEIHAIISREAQAEFGYSVQPDGSVQDEGHLGNRIATRACKVLYSHEVNLRLDVEVGEREHGTVS